MARVVGIRFRKACKIYDFSANELELIHGDTVIVEVDRGLGMGVVAGVPVEKEEKGLSYKLKSVIRKADQVDMDRQQFNHERENEAFKICSEKIKGSGLEMKLIRVEYLFDSSKAIFYFTSDGRIDFRVLVKDLAALFHTRIEMRQIGVRDEAKIVGGLGPCGRELCCTNFLSNFAPVTVKMAKEQNLALNPTKISGLCGRLMCCLSFEYRSYQKGPQKGSKVSGMAAAGHGGGGGCCGADVRAKDPGEKKSTASNRMNKDERRPRPDRGSRDERRPRQGGSGKVINEAGTQDGSTVEKKTDGEARPGEDGRPKRERRPRRGRRRGGRGRRGAGKGAPEDNKNTDGSKSREGQKPEGQKPEGQNPGGQKPGGSNNSGGTSS